MGWIPAVKFKMSKVHSERTGPTANSTLAWNIIRAARFGPRLAAILGELCDLRKSFGILDVPHAKQPHLISVANSVAIENPAVALPNPLIDLRVKVVGNDELAQTVGGRIERPNHDGIEKLLAILFFITVLDQGATAETCLYMIHSVPVCSGVGRQV